MLYPLKFKPRLLEKIWGGQKLETLGKPLPQQGLFGESWEIYDFPPGTLDGNTGWISSEVANGPLAGKTLHELVEKYGADLLGKAKPLPPHGQFPLLIKFLDAKENLSVQVHPDEAYAAGHPGAHLKTEAWYVIQSDAGSKLYKGLRPGVTRESFESAIAAGTCEEQIKSIATKAGDCFFLPSGTVHALGAGIVVAEVQTPSDTTFRVYDFNRIEAATGQPRKLHVAEAMQCIRFGDAPEAPQRRSHVAGVFTTVSRLVTCNYFMIEKVRFSEGIEQAVPHGEPVIWMMMEGKAELHVEGLNAPVTVTKGDTILLPAKMSEPTLKTLADCAWLEVTIPRGA